jgi:hypothetical protein
LETWPWPAIAGAADKTNTDAIERRVFMSVPREVGTKRRCTFARETTDDLVVPNTTEFTTYLSSLIDVNDLF